MLQCITHYKLCDDELCLQAFLNGGSLSIDEAGSESFYPSSFHLDGQIGLLPRFSGNHNGQKYRSQAVSLVLGPRNCVRGAGPRRTGAEMKK